MRRKCWSQNLREVLPKKGVWKNLSFFCLNLLFLTLVYAEWFHDYFLSLEDLLTRLWPSKNLSIKINHRYNGFLLLQENILSVIEFAIFIPCSTARILLKLLEKLELQIKLFNVPLAACKRILKIYDVPIIYDSFTSVLNMYQNL